MFSCIFQSLPYTRWDIGFYTDYEMGGKAPTTLKTNTNAEVFEELGDCYLVMVDGKTGFVAKPQVSKGLLSPAPAAMATIPPVDRMAATSP